MENPNLKMKELFADFRESMEKYENKQKQKKLAREQKRRRTNQQSSSSFTFTTAGVLLSNSDETQYGIKKKNNDSNAAPPCWGLDVTLMNGQGLALSRTDDESHARRVSLTGSQDYSLKVLKAMSSSIATTSSSISSINQDTSSIPEYIPRCEIRRRQEALELSARSSRERMPKFKPLSWNKPSFNYLPPSKISTKDIGGDGDVKTKSANNIHCEHGKGSSLSASTNPIQLGKRKAVTDEPVSNSL